MFQLAHRSQHIRVSKQMSMPMPSFKRLSKNCVKGQTCTRKSWMTQWYLHQKQVLQFVSASRNNWAFVPFKTENNFVATENTVIIFCKCIVFIHSGKDHFVSYEVNLSLLLYSKPQSLVAISLWMVSLKNLGKSFTEAVSRTIHVKKFSVFWNSSQRCLFIEVNLKHMKKHIYLMSGC